MPVTGLLQASFHNVLVAKQAGRSRSDTSKVIKAPLVSDETLLFPLVSHRSPANLIFNRLDFSSLSHFCFLLWVSKCFLTMVLGILVKFEENSDYIKEHSCISLLPFTLAVKAPGRSVRHQKVAECAYPLGFQS